MSGAAVRRVVSRLAPTDPHRASTDAELVLATAGAAREAAFALLVERYGPMVLGVCRGALGDIHDAEDAFQAVFIVLARRAGTISPPGAVGGWLYGVAMRTARKAKVAAGRRRRREMVVAAQTSERRADGSDLERAELRAAIDAELAALPEMQRAAVVLCDLHGKTRAEAATELSSPEGTVASWLARGRKALADRLARRGLALPTAALVAVAVPSAVSAGLAAAALGAAAGRGASPAAQALAEGVMRTMSTTAKFATVLAAAGLLVAAATAMWAADPPKPDPPAPKVAAAPAPAPADGKGFLDHGRTVHVTEFSPDGKRFLSVGGGTATVWDAATQKKLFTVDAEFARFGREGHRVDGTPELFVFHGKKFRILHAATGKSEHDDTRWWEGDELLAKPAGGGRWARPTADGLQRAEFDGARFACHFCVAAGHHVLDGQEAHDPKGKKSIPAYGRGGEFDETGRFAGIHAATTGYKQVACLSIWNGTSLIGTISRPGHGVMAFVWSPDGSEVAVAYPDGVRVYSTDPKSGGAAEKGADDLGPFKRLRTVEIAGATALAWAKNGNSLAVAARTEKGGKASVAVAVFDAGTGKERSRIDDFPANQPVVSLAFSPSGKRLLCGAGYFPGDETGDARTVKDAKALRVLLLADPPAPAPPWKEQAAVETVGWLAGSVAYALDGKTLFVGGSGGHARAFDPATRKELWKHDGDGKFAAVAVSGSFAFAAAGTHAVAVTGKGGVQLLDPKTGKRLDTLEAKGAEPVAVACAPERGVSNFDGGGFAGTDCKVVFGSPTGYTVRSWMRKPDGTNTPPRTVNLSVLPPGKKPADEYAVPLGESGGGRVVVTGPIDPKTNTNALWLWGAGGGAVNQVLDGHKAAVVCAAFSPDATFCATGDAAGTVIVWDATTGKERSRVQFDGRVAALAISADQKHMAAAVVCSPEDWKAEPFYDERVFVWPTAAPPAKPEPVWRQRQQGQFAGLASVAFAPDGKSLAVAFCDFARLPNGENVEVKGEVRLFARAEPSDRRER